MEILAKAELSLSDAIAKKDRFIQSQKEIYLFTIGEMVDVFTICDGEEDE